MKFARLSIVACAVTVGITAPLLPLDSAAPSRAESGLGIRYVNSVVVSDDTQFGGFKVGGLSGIDGPAAGPDVESRARLVQIHHTTGADLAEYIYPVDKVAPGALPIATGVAEILSIDADRYLTLERSLIPGKGFTARIYETSTAGADPVTGQAAAPASAKPMSKRLLFDFAANGVDPQCTEGMTWGPDLPGGARSLVLVSDNNFGQAGKTAFHLLAVDNAR
ncbi:esterase-like activity of phytase family protein [Nocardia tengchongensis]|uniref:esterase-like activity of phytase family protein n=1 Tax=Nocardia tengchongensis TaxID=2055889 RepID=UPI003611B993